MRIRVLHESDAQLYQELRLYVAPEMRGKGLGKSLMSELIKMTRDCEKQMTDHVVREIHLGMIFQRTNESRRGAYNSQIP